MLTLPPDPFLILGHRGASAHAPENSVAAFRLAADQGADGVELDARRTADGAIVVHHDAAINGIGTIVDLTLAEIRQRAPATATLAEAMAASQGLIVNIEIKNSPLDPDFDPDETVAEAVVEWVTENDWVDRVIISSFNPPTLDRVRHLNDDLATGQLIESGVDAIQHLVAAHKRGHQALHPDITALTDTPALAGAADRLGMWMFVWTVDDPDCIRAVRDAGITGIITNDPAGAVTATG